MGTVAILVETRQLGVGTFTTGSFRRRAAAHSLRPVAVRYRAAGEVAPR